MVKVEAFTRWGLRVIVVNVRIQVVIVMVGSLKFNFMYLFLVGGLPLYVCCTVVVDKLWYHSIEVSLIS